MKSPEPGRVPAVCERRQRPCVYRSSWWCALLFSVLALCSCGERASGSRMYIVSNPSDNTRYALRMQAPVLRYPGGQVCAGRLASNGMVAVAEDVVNCTGKVILRASGAPVTLVLGEEALLGFAPGSGDRVFYTGPVYFTEAGLLGSGFLGRDAALRTAVSAKPVVFPKGTELWFNKQGFIDSFRLHIPRERLSSSSFLRQYKEGIRYRYIDGIAIPLSGDLSPSVRLQPRILLP